MFIVVNSNSDFYFSDLHHSMPKAKSSNRHDGDKVEGGFKCPEAGCKSILFYITSWQRHLQYAHHYGPEMSEAKGDIARKELLGDVGKKYSGTRQCPLAGCKVGF